MGMKDIERSSRLTDQQKHLIEENLEFAIKVAMKSSMAKSLNKDDVVDLAMEGLVKAATRYQSDRGVKFMTFAYCVIHNLLIDKLKQGGSKELLVDNFEDETFIRPFHDQTELDQHEQKQRLYEFLIQHQHDREINLLIHRYFNMEDKVITQSELTDFFQLSQSQLSHLERKGKERIRQQFLKQPLKRLNPF